MPWRIGLLFLLCLSARSARAADWTLTGADFSSCQVELKSIDESGLTVIERTGSSPRTLPWDQVLALGRSSVPKVAPGKFVLYTVSGDRLHGQPAGVKAEALSFISASLGQVSIPLRRVSAIVRVHRPPPQADKNRTEDTVTLANGDAMRGIVSDITAENVTVQSNGAPATVPLDSVDAILFASTAGAAATVAREFRVVLAEGSMIATRQLKLADDRLTLLLPDKQMRQLDIANVASIEQLNGPVAWLSGLLPAESVHTPFLDIARPPRMDRSVTGEPIRFGERTYARGIGVYPYTRLTWNLPPGYAAFRTRYAFDGNAPYGDVTVRVKVDVNTVHEVKNFTAARLSPVIVVPLNSGKTLTLEVDDGANYSVQDRFNWIEPALLKQIPTPPKPATTQAN